MMYEESDRPLLVSQRIAQICMFLFAAIALFGGSMQMLVGQPDTTPRLDNIHRFLAGIYSGMGIICFWTGWTIRKQDTLVFLISLGAMMGGIGRMVSISILGIPEPHPLWLTYLGAELIIPIIAMAAQLKAYQKLKRPQVNL
ncbi:MAG: DUF4345 domain-containing protein [Cyclobacteriaceae bacterium]|nr:DUF4345 domain-containing protein [Cyclobacteriaceae bacterium]